MNGINLAATEARRRFRVHFTMWEADRTGDVADDLRIAAARADHDDRGKAGLEIDGQIPCGRVEAQLVFHRRRGFAGFGGAKFVTVMPHAAWIAKRPSGRRWTAFNGHSTSIFECCSRRSIRRFCSVCDPS